MIRTNGIPDVINERQDLASALAMLYLQTQTRDKFSEAPEAFAEAYLDARKRINQALKSHL